MIRLPFEVHDRSGVLAVDHRVNADVTESGFDMFDSADFDPRLALGCPTMRAWVETYDGTGYRTATAFVQWIDTERRTGDRIDRIRELDAPPPCREVGVPFFSYGYPASLYDAPAHNMNGADAMHWKATTWFVTAPARWNDHEIRPLVGFAWGYTEDAATGVRVSPLRVLARSDWASAVSWLENQAPAFTFSEG